MKALIVGAGIGGLCTAITLEKARIETTIFEKAAESKALGAGLGIGANALRGLQILFSRNFITRFLRSFK